MQGEDNVPGATRDLCCLSVRLQMKIATPWIMKMILEEDYVSIGRTSVQAREECPRPHQHEDIYDLFNTLLMASVGILIMLNLMNSLH